MNRSRLNIKTPDGKNLHGWMELPADQNPRQYAIFAHCFTCNSNFAAVRNISRGLTNEGFGVVRFDFTGLGKSEGDFADSNFSANIEDIETVYEYISEHYSPPALLVGHSFGGTASLVAASRLKNIKAIVTIGSPAEAEHVKHLFKTDLPEIKEKGEAQVNIGGRPFKIKNQFIEDITGSKVLDVVAKLKKPLLILHSPQDAIVGIDNAAKIYHSAFHPKSFVSLDGADHMLTAKEDSLYVSVMISAWASRYLLIGKEILEPLSTQGEQVVTHLNLENKFTTQVSNGRHTILVDEPSSVGGDDLGHSPYELLNAALGACTAMTLKMYAERKKWDLQEVYVYLTYDKKHIDDIDTQNGNSGKVNHISRKLDLKGELSDEQRKRLIEIAEKCPVHRTVTEGVVVETSEIKSK